ncbi:MAG: asparaginase [Propionibacteriaceae bacterium]
MSLTARTSSPLDQQNPYAADPIAVEVIRNGFVESVHHARVVITGPDGDVIASLGAEFAPIYPRSTLKPLQAVGLLRAGLDLTDPVDGRLLAVACASHSGEPFHLEAVTEILTRSSLDASALQTPPALPMDEASRDTWIRADRAPEPLAYNCSGKHAAMIRTAVLGGHSVTDYRDPDHPVQLAILETIDDLTGERAGELAMDGCGAPLYAVSLAGVARAFGRIAGDGGSEGPEAAVGRAMRDHPEYVSGTTRDELALLRSLASAGTPAIGKAGAEAVYALGLPDGRGIAIKIDDGGSRARPVLMAGVLARLGLATDVVTAQAAEPVLGHGEPVGEVRPVTAVLDALSGQLA